jgi:MATE family multidrug resistance protein
MPELSNDPPRFRPVDRPDARATAAIVPACTLALSELLQLVPLAGPIILTQIGQVAMMTTDIALIGRLGDEAVAAAALGQIIYYCCFVIGLGLVSAVAPLAAQAHGARDLGLVGRSLRVGLWSALLLCIPLIALQLFGASTLTMLGQPQNAADLAQRYLRGLAWSIIPALWFAAIRGLMGAVNRPEPALWITVAAIPVNGLLAYLLINGKLGLPRLDLLGAGCATSLVNLGMCAAALWFIHGRRPFREYHLLDDFFSIDWRLARHLVLVGTPISGSLLLEYGLFAAAALLMGSTGTAALAAHQVALTMAAVLFIVPFGIGMAATVRIGQHAGRGDAIAIRHAGIAAIMLGIAFMTMMASAVVGARFGIAGFFLSGGTHRADEAMELTARLLVVAASFFIADGVQTIALGALRGLKDTRLPLLFAAVCYWLIGFPAACALAFWVGLGPTGVWMGLSLGIISYGVLLTIRFHALTRSMIGVTIVASHPSSTQ